MSPRVACLMLFLLGVPCFGYAQGASDGGVTRQASDAERKSFDTWLAFFRARRAAALNLPANGIDEANYVRIGDIEQWVTVRGHDRGNPVILLLHGGPGDVTSLWADRYLSGWYPHFTVAQWDQRGSGRTLGRSGPSVASSMTIDRMVQDGIELSEYLRRNLGRQKILLVGHSWGSVFGALMAKARPELYYAFVGTGQVVDFKQGDVVAYRLAVETARASGDAEASSQLRALGPPPYNDSKGWQLLYKWRGVCEGADRFLGGLLGLALTEPGYTLEDINNWYDGQALGSQLVEQGASLDPKRLAGSFAVPVFVFQGAQDCSSPTELARAYVRSISAPRKAFVAIPQAGHFAVFMRSDEFLAELLERVRPLAAEPRNE